MNVYIKLSTGEYPRFEGDIRLEYPEIEADFICPDTYAEVVATEAPESTELNVVTEVAPELQGGVWETRWSIRDKTEDELTILENMKRDFSEKKKVVVSKSPPP